MAPSPLLHFSAAAALAYTAYTMCRAPVLPLYARELGGGPELIGLVAGASTLTGVLLKLPAGAISDAIGRRGVLLAAAMVIAVMPFTYPLTTSIAALIAVRFVHGSGTALFGPTAAAALSDLAPATERGRWLGTYSAIQGGGQAAGPVIAGVLLNVAGFAPTFLAAGVVGIIGLALVARQPIHRSAAHADWSAIAASVRAVAADSRIVMTSVAQSGQFVLHGLITAFLPIYAVESVGVSPAQAGVLFGVQMVTTITARPLFGRTSDRVGRRPMIVIGLVICAVAVASYAYAASFAALIVASCIYGAGLAVTTSSTGALITDLADRRRYGAAHGLFGTIFDVGDAIGPIAGGIVAARVGYEATFQLAAAAAAVLTLAFAVASRNWVITPASQSN